MGWLHELKFWKERPKVYEETRTLFVDDAERNAVFKFTTNFVKTSKYNVFNFLPKNLMEQFMRLANLYFVFLIILQQIPEVSPTGKFTTIPPLLMVLTLTAIKAAVEDIRRHKQDRIVNSRLVEVLRGSDFVSVPWKDVVVGDVVKVLNKTYIPADMVVISTSEPNGLCYIQTANLDGETNLKVRQAHSDTEELYDEEALRTLRGAQIMCEGPNQRLYQFVGTLRMPEGQKKKELSLSIKEFLPRGAMLRNTAYAFGVVIYTGHETKVMVNSSGPPTKRSNVEKVANIMTAGMFGLLLTMAACSAIGFSVFLSKNRDHDWYLRLYDKGTTTNAGASFFTFIILYTNLIPLSLYSSVEICKLFQAYLINNDVEMYHEESDTPALARTSDLTEELGQVQYIFSDKTGTLTRNKMEFKRCSLAGQRYGMEVEEPPATLSPNTRRIVKTESQRYVDENLLKVLRGNDKNSEISKEAFILLALCHTVIPESASGMTPKTPRTPKNYTPKLRNPEKGIQYNAASPDEGALVKAARRFGFEFKERTPKTLTIKGPEGKDIKYKLLHTLEFTNNRKRMSIIVRSPEGKLILYCKGADNVIYERLAKNNPFAVETQHHIDEFAVEGLRTLCLAKKDLDEKEYKDWKDKFQAASTVLENREKQLEDVSELIEKDLFLLGCTAVEDRLQEGVPETIATLLKAGIRLWVLTGDKQETAIEIGKSCKMLTAEMDLIKLNRDTVEETESLIDEQLSLHGTKPEGSDKLALVIDGITLQYALSKKVHRRFLQLANKCKAVICCRASPHQKADVVKLVKNHLKAITLAIGDGANDIPMIQAAHVGVGISGEEGLQAARASDYAIAQFRYLNRLLLVHGRSSYRRISKVILYSFYKNIVLYFTQFLFAFYNGFSGQSIVERWTLTVFNTVFTLIPILVLGTQDKDVSDEMIYRYPELYRIGQQKYHFNVRQLACWIGNGVYHSLISFFIPIIMFSGNDVLHVNGQVNGMWSIGLVIYTAVVFIVTIKICLEQRVWNWTWVAGLIISIVWFFIWLAAFSKLPLLFPTFGADFLEVPYNLLNTAPFWFCVILTVVVAINRDIAWKFAFRTYFPKPYHVVQDIQYQEDSSSPYNLPNKPTRTVSVNVEQVSLTPSINRWQQQKDED